MGPHDGAHSEALSHISFVSIIGDDVDDDDVQIRQLPRLKTDAASNERPRWEFQDSDDLLRDYDQRRRNAVHTPCMSSLNCHRQENQRETYCMFLLTTDWLVSDKFRHKMLKWCTSYNSGLCFFVILSVWHYIAYTVLKCR